LRWVDPFGLARGDWWDPRTYIQLAYSTSAFCKGTTKNDEGVEQEMETYVTLVGGSLDVYIGLLPSPDYTVYEIGVGWSSHLGIGYYYGNPDASGDYEFGGLAIHIGPSYPPSPIYFTVIKPKK
jgi:hypothetical protein